MTLKRISIAISMIFVFISIAYLSVEPFYTPTAIININQSFHVPRFIAHKSLVSELHLGNTFGAIQEALASPVEAIEIDVRLTQDQVPVLFHGDQMEELTDGQGAIEDTSFSEIQKLKYKDGQSKILSLSEVFKMVRGQKVLFLDVKDSNVRNSGFAKVLSTMIEEHQLHDTVIVESFNPFFLTYLRLANRSIMIMYNFADDVLATGEEVQAQLDQIPWILKQEFFRKQIRRILRPDFLGPRWSVDGDLIQNLVRKSYPLIVWTVDDADQAGKLFALGVRGIQSHRPLELQKNLNWGPVNVVDAGGVQIKVENRINVTSEDDVIKAMAQARDQKKKISISGRRHSMGGQSAASGSINLDMLGFNQVQYDEATQTIRAQSGATWRRVQALLNKNDRSVHIMQSDNIFTVGGSVSVNVHGWQVGQGPMGSSVRSMKVALPSGKIEWIKPGDHLFSYFIGGYGQFGVILEVELETVPNNDLMMQHQILRSENFEESFAKFITQNSNVELAYGRLSVSRSDLFGEAGLFWFERVPGSEVKELAPEKLVAFKRAIFRASELNDYGKRARWSLEKNFSKLNDGSVQSRNTIMSPDIHVLWPTNQSRRDILHEYFIPKKKMNEFLKVLKSEVLKSEMNLLNVTIREVKKDLISSLPYGREESFAFVLLFSQKQDARGEAQMKSFTQKMIDGVNEMGGTFYLPYRNHYSKQQVLKAYPMLPQWLDEKRKNDPEGIMTSLFFENLETMFLED